MRVLVRLLQSKLQPVCSAVSKAWSISSSCTRISISPLREDSLVRPHWLPRTSAGVTALEQVFGVPVAALHTVEIAAIDMDGRGQAAERTSA